MIFVIDFCPSPNKVLVKAISIIYYFVRFQLEVFVNIFCVNGNRDVLADKQTRIVHHEVILFFNTIIC